MTLRMTPYLMMNGNANEAIQFYEEALGAEVLNILTYGEMPMNVHEELNGKVAHAMLKVGETDLMLSDYCMGDPPQKGNQVTICISTNDVEKSKQIFETLQESGQVNHPFEETPFSPAFGVVIDKFGVTFQIVTESQN